MRLFYQVPAYSGRSTFPANQNHSRPRQGPPPVLIAAPPPPEAIKLREAKGGAWKPKRKEETIVLDPVQAEQDVIVLFIFVECVLKGAFWIGYYQASEGHSEQACTGDV